MNWSFVASALCFLSAVCLFWLHSATSPRHQRWQDMPEYLRRSMLATGGAFLWNGAVLSSMAPKVATLDHVAAASLLLLLCVASTIAALTTYVVRRTKPCISWARLNWFERKLQENPDSAPVVMSTHDVARTAQALGMAALEPNAPPRRVGEVDAAAHHAH